MNGRLCESGKCRDLGALNGFQANFPFLLGAGFSNPDYVATQGVERVVVEDDFDKLAVPQMESSV
jgi:hypothetical protein